MMSSEFILLFLSLINICCSQGKLYDYLGCIVLSVGPFISILLSITSSPSDIVLNDSAVTLSCRGNRSSAIDDPSLLSIMWYHEEMMVQLTSNVSLSDDGAAFTNTLTIDPFTISSVGDYKCVAMIDNSTAETTTTISARRKPYSLYLVLLCLHSSTSIISQCNSCRRYLHYRRYSNTNMYCNS